MIHLNTLIEQTPSADAWALRGVLRGNARDFVGARADFEAALALDPRQTEAQAGMRVLSRRP